MRRAQLHTRVKQVHPPARAINALKSLPRTNFSLSPLRTCAVHYSNHKFMLHMSREELHSVKTVQVKQAGIVRSKSQDTHDVRRRSFNGNYVHRQKECRSASRFRFRLLIGDASQVDLIARHRYWLRRLLVLVGAANGHHLAIARERHRCDRCAVSVK